MPKVLTGQVERYCGHGYPNVLQMTADTLGTELVLDSLSQKEDKIYKRIKRERERERILVFPRVLDVLIGFGVVFSCKVLKSWTEYL